jgi:peptidoglycan hydrolase-like protein with peptidoglycan-binding domain
MNHSLRFRIATVAACAAAALPFAASALTVDELQAQIKTLMGQLQGLQQQLKDARSEASTTPWRVASSTPSGHPCLQLARSLAQGMRGDDVRELQQHLFESGDLSDDSGVTGNFGPMTAAAVRKMQKRMGLASSTGAVGPQTREFLKRSCEKKMDRLEDMHGMGSSTEKMSGKGMGGDMGGIGSGVIASLGATSITVTNAAGASKTVNILDTTVIKVFNASTTQMETGTLASLAVGDHVNVHGSIQQDGTVNAVLIQKMPALPPKPAGMWGEHSSSTSGRPMPRPGMMFGGDNEQH